MFVFLFANRRRRWFRDELAKRRQVRALGDYLWERTPAVTRRHKIMQLGKSWFVCEFNGRRWKGFKDGFDTEIAAVNFVADRMVPSDEIPEW